MAINNRNKCPPNFPYIAGGQIFPGRFFAKRSDVICEPWAAISQSSWASMPSLAVSGSNTSNTRKAASLLIALFKWGVFIFVAHYTYFIFISLSGKLTSTNVGINLLAKFGEHYAPLWIVAIISIIYGNLELWSNIKSHACDTVFKTTQG